MRSSSIKRYIALGLLLGAVIAVAVALVGFGALVRYTGTGADRSLALTPAEPIPDDLAELVNWLDVEGLPRDVEPQTALLVQAAWVAAWEQVDLAHRSGDRVGVSERFMPGIDQHVGVAVDAPAQASFEQHGHTMAPTFYSIDGSVMALDISSDLERSTAAGASLRSLDDFEVVMLLSDGKWRIQHLTRVARAASS